jgi:hypothetical protein
VTDSLKYSSSNFLNLIFLIDTELFSHRFRANIIDKYICRRNQDAFLFFPDAFGLKTKADGNYEKERRDSE